LITLLANTTALAGNSTPKIKVTVNNKTINYSVAPYIMKGEVMLPMAQTSEALGAKVEWDKKNKTAWVHFDMMHIEIIVGKSEFYIHRDADFSGIPQTVKLKAPIKSIKKRIFVPGKTFFESIGMTVSWDSKKSVFSITNDSTISDDILYTVISENDISKMKDVSTWYKKKYTEAGIHNMKYDGVMYVLVSAGIKPTGGYTVGINRIFYETSDKAFVSAYFKKPSPDMMVTQVETYPHMLIKIEGSKNFTSVKGEIQEIIVDSLPTEVPYQEITTDTIKDNSILMKWYNENNQKQGISSIRNGEYIYAVISAGERPTGGYTIQLDNVFYSSYNTVSINASVTPPGDNVRVMMVITYPSTLIRIKSDMLTSIVGEVIDIKIPSKEQWVIMDSNTVTKMELFNLDQVKLRDITCNERDDIMNSFNEATIDQNAYIKMIAGNVLKVTTNDGYVITFTSYGSETNVIANFDKDGETRTFHLVAPVIARTLLQK
jgi:hypothetical protein